VFRRVHLQNETLAEVKRLRQQQQEIIQEERLNAVGGIASAIVHDFNNALTPILGFSEVLLKRPETLNNSAQTLRYLQIINEAALEAAEAVRRLRRFYRPREEHDVFQRVNPHQLVQAAILAAKAKWAESAASGTPKITVETALENVPPIRGNEIELCEAFVHIITNAFQATLCDGIVKVAVRNAGKHVCFEVQDSGEGMTEDVKKRCIEPFFTTRKRAAGLGLSVVHGVVRRHGGSLEIESQEGVGSTIRMFLPIDER